MRTNLSHVRSRRERHHRRRNADGLSITGSGRVVRKRPEDEPVDYSLVGADALTTAME